MSSQQTQPIPFALHTHPPNMLAPNTASPGFRSVTPSATLSTMPLNSNPATRAKTTESGIAACPAVRAYEPGVIGQPTNFFAEAYKPLRSNSSHIKLLCNTSIHNRSKRNTRLIPSVKRHIRPGVSGNTHTRQHRYHAPDTHIGVVDAHKRRGHSHKLIRVADFEVGAGRATGGKLNKLKLVVSTGSRHSHLHPASGSASGARTSTSTSASTCTRSGGV